MNIKGTFLSLTDRTYPHKTEADIYHLLPNLETDDFGNLYKVIGESTTMFTSHLDTATAAFTKVTHVIEGDMIKTDGKSILGADDKAGVTIMLHMMENNIPGLYYFFLGEEVGCVGSQKLATFLGITKEGIYENIKKVISFDRRGTTSVITHQSSSRCCSDEFGTALAAELNKNGMSNYKNDPSGIYTDSAKFVRLYPECTNISVGYYNEHTFREEQNIKHLEELANTCLKVDWENLPISRDPSKTEYSSHWGDWDDEYGYGYGYSGGGIGSGRSYVNSVRSTYRDSEKMSGVSETGVHWSYPIEKKVNKNFYFHDSKYNHVSSITKLVSSSSIISVDLAKERIKYEQILIEDMLLILDVDYENFSWNGFKLIVNYIGYKTECTREELSEYLPELEFWKKELEDDSLFNTPRTMTI